MSRLSPQSLRTRITFGSLVPVVLFVGTGLVAYLTIDRLLDAQEREENSREAVRHGYDLSSADRRFTDLCCSVLLPKIRDSAHGGEHDRFDHALRRLIDHYCAEGAVSRSLPLAS